jgi:hypothetical protein
MDVAGGEHGLAKVAELRFVQAALDATLAILQLPPYLIANCAAIAT